MRSPKNYEAQVSADIDRLVPAVTAAYNLGYRDRQAGRSNGRQVPRSDRFAYRAGWRDAAAALTTTEAV